MWIRLYASCQGKQEATQHFAHAPLPGVRGSGHSSRQASPQEEPSCASHPPSQPQIHPSTRDIRNGAPPVCLNREREACPEAAGSACGKLDDPSGENKRRARQEGLEAGDGVGLRTGTF